MLAVLGVAVTEGTGATGGNGFTGSGLPGGNGGVGSNGLGGGIFNGTTGTLTISPRLGTRKGSRQSNATNTITANHADRGPEGPAAREGPRSLASAGRAA